MGTAIQRDILASPPYAARDDVWRLESLDALLDEVDGWPADWRDGFGRKTTDKGTSQTWQVNAADVMLLVWQIARLTSERDEARAKAIEECATISDGYYSEDNECSKAIRALLNGGVK